MSKGFDNLGEGAQQREWHRLWLVEALRVLRPGGVIAAFSGSRTRHHLVAGMVDAGFGNVVTRAWGYGSGFPKNKDVLRFSIPEAIARSVPPGFVGEMDFQWAGETCRVYVSGVTGEPVGVPKELAHWGSYGTALKPAYEPCVFGIKPG